ncbi:MAG: AEC family transporter [Clostridia bacterium]|nr:AEC family transporter [Clostridia bacterium]
MQISFLTVLIAVVSLVILAVPGFLLVKTKLLNEKSEGAFSNLVLYGAQPIMVLMSFQNTSFSAKIGKNVLIVAGLTIVIHLIMAVIMMLVIKNKGDTAKKSVVRYGSMFSNAGFMGFPFLQIVFADSPVLGEAMIYAAVLVSVFLFINWTLGVYIITGDKSKISLKKVILNPTIIAIILGFIFFLTIKVPFVSLTKEGTTTNLIVSKLIASLDVIGDLVTPLSMTVIGMKLARANLKDLFLDKWGYVVCFFKLIVMSILTMLCVSFLPIAETIKYVLVFLLSMPCATSTALLPIIYGGDSKSASAYVLLSCMACILTIPLMFLLFTVLL